MGQVIHAQFDSEKLHDTLTDRRRSFRVEVPAVAMLWSKGQLEGRYDVRDLSIGGCRLSNGPRRTVGDTVKLLVHLPQDLGEFALPATVVRHVDRGMGMRFADSSPAAEDCIHELVLQSLQKRRAETQTTLVVGPNTAGRQTLVQVLRQLGRRAIGVPTPLDAVQLLVEEGHRIDTAFIEIDAGSRHGMELVEFLAHNHPTVRRVVLGQDERRADLADAQATGTVDGIVGLPADKREVRRVLMNLGCAVPGPLIDPAFPN